MIKNSEGITMYTTKVTRTEKDSLGNFDVPAEAYYSIFTERAKRISGFLILRQKEILSRL